MSGEAYAWRAVGICKQRSKTKHNIFLALQILLCKVLLDQLQRTYSPQTCAQNVAVRCLGDFIFNPPSRPAIYYRELWNKILKMENFTCSFFHKMLHGI